LQQLNIIFYIKKLVPRASGYQKILELACREIINEGWFYGLNIKISGYFLKSYKDLKLKQNELSTIELKVLITCKLLNWSPKVHNYFLA
jgi:hypothetical protein